MNLSMRLMTLKYFCGTLFTRLCFLERPKENHKLGDVCVHGKVSRFDTFFPLLIKSTSCPHIFSSNSVCMSKGKIFVMSPITVYFIFVGPTYSTKKTLPKAFF
ncbi:hypothetical protein IMY05_008G0107200 [Salix suchowensis]|nr:hypothetical protein IMY05_008G0107200 [Salix suchowensis]